MNGEVAVSVGSFIRLILRLDFSSQRKLKLGLDLMKIFSFCDDVVFTNVSQLISARQHNDSI